MSVLEGWAILGFCVIGTMVGFLVILLIVRPIASWIEDHTDILGRRK